MILSVSERLRLKGQCYTEAYSGHCQTSKMDDFAKIVNG